MLIAPDNITNMKFGQDAYLSITIYTKYPNNNHYGNKLNIDSYPFMYAWGTNDFSNPSN